MVPQLRGCPMEEAHGVGRGQRRGRVLVVTRTLEDIAAWLQLAAQVSCLAADAHQLLGTPVIILELIVSYAPVLNCPIRRHPGSAEFFSQMTGEDKEVRQIAVGDPTPMFG